MISKQFTSAAALLCALFASAGANAADVADVAEPDDDFSVMKWLAEHGAHSLEHERWNAYAQLTYISSWKRPLLEPER